MPKLRLTACALVLLPALAGCASSPAVPPVQPVVMCPKMPAPAAWAMDESDPDTLRRMVGFADTVDIEPACEWVYKYWFPERE